MSDRQVPFYCPYCGDQDLRPSGPEGGGWQCAACARAFELRFTGVAPGSAGEPRGAQRPQGAVRP
jgi:transposase-like protein